MKRVNLRDVFRWKGELTEVVSINDGHRSIGFKTRKKVHCPNCNKEFEQDEWHDIIESAPIFKECAESVNTIDLL